ncbi:MAG: GPR endopeptidase [Ruminococcaceae bacterium]|nr:GPR endopeptidase [Oscillospiraceae bacterium]
MFSIRTDLAIEAHEMLTESTSDIQGVACDTSRHNNIAVTRVTVSTEEAAKALGKPVGRYITLEFNELNLADAEYHAYICKQLANELNGLLPKKEKQLILVVGLGNHNITPDALGPLVVSKVLVTRHLMHQPPFTAEKGIGPVSAIAPGVLGLTGMETAEIVQGISGTVKPDAVIVIDALAARNLNRLNTTIQLCDTGISPGAGVGNKRKELNQKTLGIPVIAVGVPTVIDAATLTADVMHAMTLSSGADEENERSKMLAALHHLLPEDISRCMVTPKDIDLTIETVSKIVAGGINLALHKGLTLEDVNAYTS